MKNLVTIAALSITFCCTAEPQMSDEEWANMMADAFFPDEYTERENEYTSYARDLAYTANKCVLRTEEINTSMNDVCYSMVLEFAKHENKRTTNEHYAIIKTFSEDARQEYEREMKRAHDAMENIRKYPGWEQLVDLRESKLD